MAIYNFHLRLRPEVITPDVRRYRPGHYLSIGNENSQRFNYLAHIPLPGLQGFLFRYDWKNLETSEGVYTAQPILEDLARVASVTTARGTKDSQMIAMIVEKTFKSNPTNPLPAYLIPYSGPNNGGGYSSWRWHTFVSERYVALANALGPLLDQNPNFAGFAVQETSLGFGSTPGNGYTDVLYRDALIADLLGVANATPHAVVYFYQNFFPSTSTDFRLDEVVDAVKGKGVIMGGPDILPDKADLKARVYPRYRDPPKGVFGEMPLFCAAQFDSYRFKHQTTSPPDNRAPGFTWTTNDYWTPEQMFLWATGANSDSIHLQTIVWENQIAPFFPSPPAVAPGSPTVADSKAVWAKYPTWTIAGGDDTP